MQHEPHPNNHECGSGDGSEPGDRVRPPESGPAPPPAPLRKLPLRKFGRGPLRPKLGEQALEALDFGVGFTRAVPQVIVFHRLFPFVELSLRRPSLVAALEPTCKGAPIAAVPSRAGSDRRYSRSVFVRSFSRSCCIPRHRLTRTEPAVRPVRAAISGPVIPSTRRRIRVSR